MGLSATNLHIHAEHHDDAAAAIASHHRSVAPLTCFNFSASCSRPNELSGRMQREQLSLSTVIMLHQCCQTSADSDMLFNFQATGTGGWMWGRKESGRWCFMYAGHHRGEEVFVEMQFSSSRLLLWRWPVVRLCTH